MSDDKPTKAGPALSRAADLVGPVAGRLYGSVERRSVPSRYILRKMSEDLKAAQTLLNKISEQ